MSGIQHIESTQGDRLPVSGISPWGIDRISLTGKLPHSLSRFNNILGSNVRSIASHKIRLEWMTLFIDQEANNYYLPFNPSRRIRGHNCVPASVDEVMECVRFVVPYLEKKGIGFITPNAKISQFELARVFTIECTWSEFVDAMTRYVNPVSYKIERKNRLVSITNSNWKCKAYLQAGSSDQVKLEITCRRGRVHTLEFGELLGDRVDVCRTIHEMMYKHINRGRKILGYRHV